MKLMESKETHCKKLLWTINWSTLVRASVQPDLAGKKWLRSSLGVWLVGED